MHELGFLFNCNQQLYVCGFLNVNTLEVKCHKLQEYEVLKCNLTSHSLSRFFINLNSHSFFLHTCLNFLFEFDPINLQILSGVTFLFVCFPYFNAFVYVLKTMENWESLPFLVVLFFWFIRPLTIFVRCVACFLLVA
jgi:hypothetical protein